MPIVLKIAASSGIAMTPPMKRGAHTRRTGSTAIISIADSWSVALIRPISDVSAVPARPANSSAVTTGPSSRSSPSATADPAPVVRQFMSGEADGPVAFHYPAPDYEAQLLGAEVPS